MTEPPKGLSIIFVTFMLGLVTLSVTDCGVSVVQLIVWKVGLTIDVGAIVLIPIANVCVTVMELEVEAVMLYTPGCVRVALAPEKELVPFVQL